MEHSDGMLQLQPQLLLPRFNGEKFQYWKTQMKAMFKSKDLWEIVEGGIPTKDNKQVQSKDSEALFYIFRAVDEKIFSEIAILSSAKEAWDRLEMKYEKAGQESKEYEKSKESEESKIIKGAHLDVLGEARNTNYLSWKTAMIKYLEEQGMEVSMNQQVSEGDLMALNESTMKKKNDEAISIIYQHCNGMIQSFIKDLYPAKIVWRQLDVIFHHPEEAIPELQKMTTYTWCQEFYNNIVGGKHKKVESFLKENEGVVACRITVCYDFPLHVAARAGKLKIVKLLLGRMSSEEIMTRNGDLRTALHLAASSGHLKVVKALVEKERRLLLMQAHHSTSLHLAIRNRQKEVVKYLYHADLEEEKTSAKYHETTDRKKFWANILCNFIHGRFFDLALDLLKSFPDLLLVEDAYGETAITALIECTSDENKNWWKAIITPISTGIQDIKSRLSSSRKRDVENPDNADRQANPFVPVPLKSAMQMKRLRLMPGSAFNLLRLICQRVATEMVIDVNNEGKKHREMKALMTKALFLAVEKGNVDFIAEILRYCPQLARLKNEQHMTLFHAAILNRQDRIFKLILDLQVPLSIIYAYKENQSNNTLHLVAMLPPKDRLNQISGAALQLRNELIWFMKVQGILPPNSHIEVNRDNKTPKMLFNETHHELFKDGEEWMKRTVDACMVVAALVASVMLSATLSLPGATKNDTGITIFIQHKIFYYFVVSNMVSLLFSSASMIAFLSIYMSRFTEVDFLDTLPWMLCIGLLFLFISIAAMMTTFVSTLLMVLRDEIKWAMIPPASLAILPIAILSLRQLPILLDMMLSTYSLSIFTQSRRQLNV
ncbi:PREDICTED: uncharacterized protein LOC104610787 isoform X1 [Nelumbo nucifera]|uniref:PGG domain-containing protein n=2 Tax=Nelumbo nucifera TaxID=4432 RepID=A0A822YS67_NELNU|nr:PREDICTED: uncharacterized protein LOC104610787 isoform X1 [Nelumbo nucifera]DAD33895.1 TPA_asm: hypothetical protein HUJ06_012746 [Nelumbo nucifera]